jgi:hypothetical protein
VTECRGWGGAQKRKGLVVIPEGHDRWGWRGFSLALNGLLGQTNPATNHAGTSQGVSWPTSSRKGDRNSKVVQPQYLPLSSLSLKGAVMNRNKISDKSAFIGDLCHAGFKKNIKEVNSRESRVELLLQLNLVLGPRVSGKLARPKLLTQPRRPTSTSLVL